MMELSFRDTLVDFLAYEAGLLDDRRWDEWLSLFTPDGIYWVPAVPGQTDPINHVSLFYEDAMMRSVRARRLEEQRAWSQQPTVRASRTIGNVRIVDDEEDIVVVSSTFTMVEWRPPTQRILAGRYTHRLQRHGDGFLILEKRADLINCDGVLDLIEAFI